MPALWATLGAFALLQGCSDDETPASEVRISSFEAAPGRVERGASVELRWSVRDAQILRITDDAGGVLVDSEAFEEDGSIETDPLFGPRRFTLEVRANARGNPVRAEVEVDVDVPGPRFIDTDVVPSLILAGQAAAIRWSAENVVAVDVRTSTGGVVLLDGPAVGETVVRPSGSRTFVLTARGFETEVTEMVVLAVGNRPPTIERFAASPPRVVLGQTTTLSWRASGADAVQVESSTGTIFQGPQIAGRLTLRPSTEDVYTLTATGLGGASSSTITVPVDPPTPLEVERFVIEPNPSARGEAAALAWSVRGASEVQIVQNGMTLIAGAPRSGRQPVNLTTDVSQFVLTATGAAGSVRAERTAFVHDPAAIQQFELSPRARASAGGDLDIVWSAGPLTQIALLSDLGPVPGFPVQNATVASAQQLSAGSLTVTATRTTRFALEAASAAGAASETRIFVIGVEEQEPNDTPQQALPATSVVRDHLGQVDVGEVDVFLVEVEEGGSIVAETTSGPGACDLDTQLSLRGEDGLLVEDDDGGRGTCSSIDPVRYPAAGLLKAGVYSLEVRSRGLGTYVLRAGPGAQRCGNGARETPEVCDDGNRLNGDGCDAACRLEPSGPLLGSPGGTVDLTAVSSAAARILEVNIDQSGQSLTSTAASPGGGCTTVDTRLELLDSTGQVRVDNRGGGPTGTAGTCASLVPSRDRGARDLAIGRYFLRLTAESTAVGPVRLTYTVANPACGNGLLETRGGEQCDDGNLTSGDGCTDMCVLEGGAVVEQEPNDRQVDAFPSGLVGAGRVQLRGDIRPSGDDDVISFEIPAQTQLRLFARTYSLSGQPTSCDRTLTDTRIFVEAAGTEVAGPGQGELAFNDDLDPSQNIWCSQLRGLSLSGGAAGGTLYYLRIQGWQDRAPATWFLDLELRP